MPVRTKWSHLAIRLLAGLAILLAVVAAPGASPAAGAPLAALPPAAGLRGFQLVAPNTGWVLIGAGLYWTADDGQVWQKLPVPLTPGDTIRTVWFTDARTGWLVSSGTAETGAPGFQLWRTADSGQTWQSDSLNLPPEVVALAGDTFLQFLDAQTGWLVVKQATSSLFSLGTLFTTADGGHTWQQIPLPAGGPIHFSSARDGVLDSGSPTNQRYATHDGGLTWLPQTGAAAGPGLAEQSMATDTAGWMVSESGECEAQTCQLTTRLLATADNGVTWRALTLPDGQPLLQRRVAAPTEPGSSPAANSPGLSFVYNGDGFDTCMIGALPSLADMQTWFSNSPYRVRNLYLGGASLPNCGHLTFNYVQQLAQQGWVFVPTWVGPQPPCANVGHKFSADPATAFNQGLIEADLALDAAANLGFTLSGRSGTIIYYDVEFYHPPPPPDDLPCRQAAQAFISGWTAGLHGHGSLSGVYGSPCGSYVADMSAIPNVPDSVWLARWSYTSYEPNVPIFGLNCIDDSLWTNSQRLRQYTGGHGEDWGGATLNIDSDVVHGTVTTVRGNCVPNANQAALFIFPNYGGACVIKEAGTYSTVASLGLPNDTISSIRVGANMVVRLCEHEFQGGTCENFAADTPELAGHPLGDNQASSAIVQPGNLTGTTRIYLPIFPISPGGADIPNGGFESGPADWITVSALQRPLIVNAAQVASQGVSPHTGNWLAWLGGADGETAYLLQTLPVPASTPYLSYWHWLASAETSCSFDYATLWVNNTAVNSYGLCTGANTNGWTQHVVNLSAYAGTNAAIRLQFTTDDSLTSSLFVDDFTFQNLP
ncbi:MAG: glycoside hydrolase domain-containing protein [Anaerolineales bacterium]